MYKIVKKFHTHLMDCSIIKELYFQLKLLTILNFFISTNAIISESNQKRRQTSFPSFNLGSSSSSYSGPSSYTTSFGNEFPASGNFGSLMSLNNPIISSSYTTYGPPSEAQNGFTSTSFTNYPEIVLSQGTVKSSEWLPQTSNSQVNMGQNSLKTFSHTWPQNSFLSSNQEITPISQHVEVTKPIVIPVYKKFPYPVSKKYAIKMLANCVYILLMNFTQ